MRVAKQKHIPAPTAYNNVPAANIKNIPKSTTGQMLMNDDCKYKSMQVPGAKYNMPAAFDACHERPFKLKIIADKDAGKNKYKIVKSKLPDVGTYKTTEAFKQT